MEKFRHTPLDLESRPTAVSDTKVSYGADSEAVVRIALEHSIHRQARFGMHSEIARCPLRWFKAGKHAGQDLTPDWAAGVVEEMLVSILLIGYVGFKVIKDTIVVAPMCKLDVVWDAPRWRLTDQHEKAGWKVCIVYPPDQFRTNGRSGGAACNSPAVHTMRDTFVYDELYENMMQRDHFNSRPSWATTIAKEIRNSNGSSRQWFEQAPSRDSAAARQLNVDTSFNSLIAKRADMVQRLDELSALHRERLSAPAAKTGKVEKSYTADNNMQHSEFVVTDGRDIHKSTPLMSLTDGEHMLERAAHDIFMGYKVPPQVLGKNINSERTSVNPRLNEMALDSFFTHCDQVRAALSRVFANLSIDGAVLQFVPKATKFDMTQLLPFTRPAVMATMLADLYTMQPEDFDMQLIAANQSAPMARKRTHRRRAPTELDKTNDQRHRRSHEHVDAESIVTGNSAGDPQESKRARKQ